MGRWVKCAVQWVSPTVVATTVLFAPLSQAQDKAANAHIEALAEKYDLSNLPVSQGQSRLVFYRLAQPNAKGAASVYINGRYHASLVPGGYSPICIQTGPIELGVRFMDVNNRPNKDGFDSITELKTQSTQNHYIRVNNQGSKAIALTPVSAAEAIRELASTQLQVPSTATHPLPTATPPTMGQAPAQQRSTPSP
jgi:OOP family OmpA-OmpF porin